MTNEEIKDIFDSTETIAAVGLSSKEERPSFGVCGYLIAQGYRVIPVNPNETEVHAEQAYPELKAVPDKIDLVLVFRRRDAVPAIVDDAIAIGAKVVWMQDGAGNEEAAQTARDAGLTAVVDDCMLRQHKRLYS